MKWLIDAQLPRRLVILLRGQGHDAVHTLELSRANSSSDAEILDIAKVEERIVVTKD